MKSTLCARILRRLEEARQDHQVFEGQVQEICATETSTKRCATYSLAEALLFTRELAVLTCISEPIIKVRQLPASLRKLQAPSPPGEQVKNGLRISSAVDEVLEGLRGRGPSLERFGSACASDGQELSILRLTSS